MPSLDLLTFGRANLDLYAQETGVPFVDVQGWNAMVGGSPTNVAIAASRLGLRSAVFTAVGVDLVGDWVLAALAREGVDTAFVVRKPGPHTSLALRAQLAPDHPLAFYRHDPADIHLTLDDAGSLPLDRARALLISADALARGTTRGLCSTILAAAKASQSMTVLDLDLRQVNWGDLDQYASAVATILGEVDVVLGTEEEFAAALRVAPREEDTVQAVLERLPRSRQAVVVKQGARGATTVIDGSVARVDGFPVAEVSSIGAGDSFAAGLIHARLSGRNWAAAGEFASACAAITVSRAGCSSGFPRRDEVDAFIGMREAPKGVAA